MKIPTRRMGIGRREIVAVTMGDAAAMNRLGMCCLEGIGMDENPQEAARWFQRAADLGNPAGMFNFGKCCLRGTGLVKDRREAGRWLRKAAAKGDPNAREIVKLLDD